MIFTQAPNGLEIEGLQLEIKSKAAQIKKRIAPGTHARDV
jgi:hypothetical protein